MTPGEVIVAGRFPLGQLVITPAAAGRLTPGETADRIARHARGDWDDITAENELASREGFRLLSAYGRVALSRSVLADCRVLIAALVPEDRARLIEGLRAAPGP
jgi:hypothetical protein